MCDGIYLSFSNKPLVKNEMFCEEDRNAIFKAVDMVGDRIHMNSPFHNNTVIKICSLQYDLCYYQEEGMVVVILNWCAKTFHFDMKEVRSSFDYINNRYIYDFE